MKKVSKLVLVILLAISLPVCGFREIAGAANACTSSSFEERIQNSAEQGNSHDGKAKPFSRVKVLSVAAAVLGKTQDELREMLKDQKLGEILVKANKLEAFKTEYLKTLKTNLDQAVKAGRLTQDKANEIYAHAETRVNQYDGTKPFFEGKGHHRHGKRGDWKKPPQQ